MKIAQMPRPEQLRELLQGPEDTPVVMLNLLRFKERADQGDRSGEDAYREYASRMRKIVESQGGRFLWGGRVDSQVIGESDVPFHVIGLVEYPNRETFLKIASSREVAEISVHRSAGLEGQWLIASTATEL